MKKGNSAYTEGIECMGHSNWTICSLLSQFCSEIFPTFYFHSGGAHFLITLESLKLEKGIHTKLNNTNRQILASEGSVYVPLSPPRKETVAFRSSPIPVLPPFLRPPSAHCPPPFLLLSFFPSFSAIQLSSTAFLAHNGPLKEESCGGGGGHRADLSPLYRVYRKKGC